MRVSLVLLSLCLVAGCQSGPTPPTPTDDAPPAAVVATAQPQATAPPRALSLVLEPIPARQGGQVQVSGRGFDPAESVSFAASKAVDGVADLQLGRASASPQGSVDSVALTLPDELASGPHALEAVGQTSDRRSTATLWIRAREPWLVQSTYDIQPLAELGLIAGGFEPQEAVSVSLEWRRDPPTPAGLTGPPEPVALVDLPADQAGNTAWAETKLPLVRPGGYSLVLRGASGGQELRRDLQLMPLKPNAELSPWAGPPGIPLQLNARGFAPNERVHVAFGGPSVEAAVVQADAEGNLWGAGPVRVPATVLSGPLAVLLSGEQSGATASPAFTVLEVKPWLELTTWWGAPGGPVGFGGGGWIGGERVTLHVGSASSPALAESRADDYGWLHVSTMAAVPQDAEGDVTFVALGEQSHATAKAVFSVVFPFDLRPRKVPSPVPAG
jgi:hypothetical protein